jgi:hypothetical protein
VYKYSFFPPLSLYLVLLSSRYGSRRFAAISTRAAGDTVMAVVEGLSCLLHLIPLFLMHRAVLWVHASWHFLGSISRWNTFYLSIHNANGFLEKFRLHHVVALSSFREQRLVRISQQIPPPDLPSRLRSNGISSELRSAALSFSATLLHSLPACPFPRPSLIDRRGSRMSFAPFKASSHVSLLLLLLLLLH